MGKLLRYCNHNKTIEPLIIMIVSMKDGVISLGAASASGAGCGNGRGCVVLMIVVVVVVVN